MDKFFAGRTMTYDCKKPGVAFWATVGLVTVLVYLASFGPACRIASRRVEFGFSEKPKIPTFYWPILTLSGDCPGVGTAVLWYVKVCVPRGREVLVPFYGDDGELNWARFIAEPE